MTKLEELRSQIDVLDKELASLLTKRLLLCAEVGFCKKENGLPVRDCAREAALLEHLRPYCGEMHREVSAVYTEILAQSRHLQGDDGVIDVTRELLSAQTYPGDPSPTAEQVMKLSEGDPCNLTRLELCVHNSTHADAPLHFIEGAADIASLSPSVFVGSCLVITPISELLSPEDIDALPQGCERLLIRHSEVDELTAAAIVKRGVRLVGVEPQSVGSHETHRILLGAGIALLEGLDLSAAADGAYTLMSAPLKIAGCEGAPCRVLLK